MIFTSNGPLALLGIIGVPELLCLLAFLFGHLRPELLPKVARPGSVGIRFHRLTHVFVRAHAVALNTGAAGVESEPRRLRAAAFSLAAAERNRISACSQFCATPSPLMYILASLMGASGLPFATDFHNQAEAAALSLALAALASSSAPGAVFAGFS